MVENIQKKDLADPKYETEQKPKCSVWKIAEQKKSREKARDWAGAEIILREDP